MENDSLRRFEPWLVVVCLAYFAYRLLGNALSIAPFLPPDESTRFGICEVFSRVWFLPENSENTWHLGLVTHIPALYYFLCGKLLHLNVFPISDLSFLRICNALLSISMVYLAYRWISTFTQDVCIRLLFLVIMTNTAMLTFLGAAVSYDNLNNLLAMATLYNFHCYKRTDSMRYFLLFLVSVLAGSLVKTSFLPLSVLFVLLMLWEWRAAPVRLRKLWEGICQARGWNILLCALALLLLFVNLGLYGGNLLRYGNVVPNSSQVLPLDAALKNRIFARGWIAREFREGRMNLAEAREAIETIDNPGDRAAALRLVKIAAFEQQRGVQLMNRIQYAWFWLRGMTKGIVGIVAHRDLFKSAFVAGLYRLLFLAGILAVVRYWHPHDAHGQTGQAMLLCGAYLFILMQFVNYSNYQRLHYPYLALQGRYTLPVLPMFYGLIVYYSLKNMRGSWKLITALLVGGFFIWGDYIFFCSHAGPEFFIGNG